MNAKQVAAIAAVNEVKSGMIVGLGTGSTSGYAIEEIGKRVRSGLSIQAVASSIRSEQAAKKVGISIKPFHQSMKIDLYIDGADEVDHEYNLIKGGGGALLREKILAYNAEKFIVIVDESKIVDQLGKFPLPVEITAFACELTISNLQKLECQPILRMDGALPFSTDNGNFIIDCHFTGIHNPAAVEQKIHEIPGVVECGLFQSKLVHQVLVGYNNGNLESYFINK